MRRIRWMALPLLVASPAAFAVLPTITPVLPVNNATYSVGTAGATIPLVYSVKDSDGLVTKVEYYAGTTLLGTTTVTGYTTNATVNVSASWNVAVVGTYAITAKVYDDAGGVTTSAVSNVTVVAVDAVNTAPVVTLDRPSNGSTLVAPAALSVNATATDAGGSINRVEFFVNSAYVKTAMSLPYAFRPLTTLNAGNYTVQARAYDNKGVYTDTTISNVSVLTSSATNIVPTVTITSPAANSLYNAPATYSVTADALDSDGTINRVEFFEGTAWIGTDTVAPYSITRSGATAGVKSLTAVAYDNVGGPKTSAVVSITVNALPTVSLSAPAVGTYANGEAIAVAATAADSDGTSPVVEFYANNNGAGNVLIGTASAAPYTISWTPSAAGSYVISAKATDNRSALTWSTARTITVNAGNVAPTTSLSVPTANAVVDVGTAITFTASATDELNVGVTKVEFFALNQATNTTTSIGALTAPTSKSNYTVVWSNAPAAAYTVYAVATDKLGLSTTTATPRNLYVNMPPVISLSVPNQLGGFNGPAKFDLEAAATDQDGVIAKVEFFQTGATAAMNTDTVAPYSYQVTNAVAGSYSFYAKVTDNRGRVVTSNTVTVTVDGALTPTTYSYDELGRLIGVTH